MIWLVTRKANRGRAFIWEALKGLNQTAREVAVDFLDAGVVNQSVFFGPGGSLQRPAGKPADLVCHPTNPQLATGNQFPPSPPFASFAQ